MLFFFQAHILCYMSDIAEGGGINRSHYQEVSPPEGPRLVRGDIKRLLEFDSDAVVNRLATSLTGLC